MAINKVVYGNNTLIDISSTTADVEDVIDGKIFFAKDGTAKTGTYKIQTATASVTNSNDQTTSLSFTIQGEPKMFALRLSGTDLSLSNKSYYYIINMMCDGTHIYGNYVYRNTRVYRDTTHYSFSYNNGILTVNSSGSRGSSGGSFYNNTYELFYIY